MSQLVVALYLVICPRVALLEVLYQEGPIQVDPTVEWMVGTSNKYLAIRAMVRCILAPRMLSAL